MIKKASVLLFVALFGLLFVYSKDIKQINEEYLFLTTDGIEKLEVFKENNPEINSLILNSTNQVYLKSQIAKITNICQDECELIEKLNLNNELALIVMSDSTSSILKDIINEYKNDKLINMLGHSYTNALLDDYSKVIQDKIFPAMFLTSFIILLFLTRNFLGSIILFFPCLFSAVMSLSFLKLILHSMNMVTSIVPLMSFVVSLCLTQHLYFSLDPENNLKLKEVLKYKLKPILLMISTTFIGFSSLYLSSIEVIRIFGLFSAFLIVMSSFVVILWLNISQNYLKIKKQETNPVLNWVIQIYPKNSISKMNIYTLSLVLALASIFVIKNIPIITDATEYFPKSSHLKQKMMTTSTIVGGIPILEISILFDKEISMHEILELDALEQEIKKIPQINIISNNSVVKEVNAIYSKETILPNNYNAYLALRSKAPMAFKNSYSVGENFYHLTILGNVMNVDLYEEILNSISTKIASKKLKFEFNGLYYNLMISQKEMVFTLIKSFISSLLVIILIAFFALRKIKIISSFLIVNSLPVLFSMLFLYTFKMSLNIATIMTYSIALGMVVDSTFHMIHALEHKEQTFLNFKESTIIPIVTSSLILIISFSLFMFEDFIPIMEFGMNLSFIIFVGLVFDIFVLPTLYLGHNKTSENFYE